MTDAIHLTTAERMELRRRASSRTDRAEDARRARLILLLAEGRTWDEASERIDCSRGFVASWSKRFAEQRALGDHQFSDTNRVSNFHFNPPIRDHNLDEPIYFVSTRISKPMRREVFIERFRRLLSVGKRHISVGP